MRYMDWATKSVQRYSNVDFKNPGQASISPDGTFAIVGSATDNLIKKITLSLGFTQASVIVAGSTTAGWVDGVGTNAKFKQPYSVAIAPNGLVAFVADSGNNAIRRLFRHPGQPHEMVSRRMNDKWSAVV